MEKIEFVDQTIRHGQQSLWGYQMRTDHILPIAETIDSVGYKEVATVGGNGCVVQMRNLKEDPWERSRLLSQALKRTPLRGSFQLFGLADFDMTTPRDVIGLWIKRSVANGVKSFWVCDYQTDMDKFAYFARIAKEEGAAVHVSLCAYTNSPYHTNEYYAQKTRLIAQVKQYVDAIEIGDPCGVLLPHKAGELVAAVKNNCDGIPLEFHSNCNTGLAPLTYLEAIKAGVRIVHTTAAPLANGTSLPSVENILKNIRQMGFKADVDEDAIAAVSEHFRSIAELEGYPIGVPAEFDLVCFEHSIPGGMMTNFIRQLKEVGMEHLLPKLLEEVAQVRKDLGYPVMATPYSQIVGVQALENVVSGEWYKNILDATIKYVLGIYGEPAGPVDQKLKDKIMGLPRTKEFLNQPDDYLKPIEDIRAKLGPELSDDELLLRIMVPVGPIKFTAAKREAKRPAIKQGPSVRVPAEVSSEFSVDVDGEVFNVKISPVWNGDGAAAGGGGAEEASSPSKGKKDVPPGAVLANAAGLVLSFEVKVGDTVNAGDVVALIEAMKMRRYLNCPHGGVVQEICAAAGDIVQPQDVMMVVA